jgi:hypothetical protein
LTINDQRFTIFYENHGLKPMATGRSFLWNLYVEIVIVSRVSRLTKRRSAAKSLTTHDFTIHDFSRKPRVKTHGYVSVGPTELVREITRLTTHEKTKRSKVSHDSRFFTIHDFPLFFRQILCFLSSFNGLRVHASVAISHAQIIERIGARLQLSDAFKQRNSIIVALRHTVSNR